MALTPDARRDISHALYTLVMNTCEMAIAGEMPAAGPDGLTHLACDNIADLIVGEVEKHLT